MALVNYPYTLTNGTAADASQVQAMFNAVGSVVDGGLDATNIETGTPIAQTSLNGLVAGDSNLLALADHEHILQGVENAAADPSSGNFAGRIYFNTGDQTIRECIDPSGSGTWITIGNLSASDLPNHAANHAQSGTDALPAGAVSNSMLGRSLVTSVLGSNVSNISNAWTDCITGISLTTTVANQVVNVTGAISASETGGSNNARVAWRIRDSSTTVAGRPGTVIVAGTNSMIPVSQFFTLASVATHTLKLQVWKGSDGTVTIEASESDSSETLSTQVEICLG